MSTSLGHFDKTHQKHSDLTVKKSFTSQNMQQPNAEATMQHLFETVILFDALEPGVALPVAVRAAGQAAMRHGLSVVVLARSERALATLRESWPAVRLHAALTLPDERPGEALNTALARCPGHVVLVRARALPELAPNAAPGPDDWLSALLAAAARHPEAGLVAARCVTMDGRIWADGHNLVNGLGLHHPGYLGRHLEDDTGTTGHEADGAELDVAFLRREALQAVARQAADPRRNEAALPAAVFDPHLDPAGLLDDDLAFAVRAAGFSVRVTGSVKAVRLTPVTPPEGVKLPALAAAFERAAALRRVEAEYWARKWGWDPLLPDTGRLRRLYGRSQAGWQLGETLRWPVAEAHPAVDLCMVTWNGAAHLERCLQSLAATRYPADRLTLYLVDNASTDATPALLERLLPELPFATSVQRLAVNVGGVAGMNWAMAQGHGALVAKLDDDIIVPPDWLEQLVDVFRQRPFAGVTGPKIVDDTAVRRIQCADYACHPQPVTHEQETDEGQTDALARVTHVRGCCNLYRRDAIKRCGPLDIRFSPSQWDDPDHQLALLVAGYEVVHQGRVTVAHKMTTGSVSSGLSLANAALNKAKMQVKWGHDAPLILESALLLSDEGRYVGPWTDPTPGPCSAPGPHLVEPDLVRHTQALCEPLRLGTADSAALERMLHAQARQLVAQATASRQQGQEAAVLPQLRAAVSCAPHDPLPLLALSEALGDNDAQDKAALLRRRAAALGAAPQGRALLPPPSGMSRPQAIVTGRPQAGTEIGTGAGSSGSQPHALWCMPHSRRFDAPLRTRLEDAATALESHGWRVTLDSAPCPRFDAAPYDLVHAWTLDAPHETLAQLKAAATLRPALPRLLSPLWDDPVEGHWLARAVPHLRQHGIEGLPPWPVPDPGAKTPLSADDDPTAALCRRQALELASPLLFRQRSEAAQLGAAVRASLPEADCRFTGVSLPALPGTPPDPRLFREASGLNDFVLAVAPITPAAGQAQLLAAVASLNLPVVLVGEAPEAWYLHLCRRLMPSCLFVREAEPDLLASAFAAARVHALPALASLGERGALMAARLGTPVVAARTSPECHALTTARPCDPHQVPSIAAAISRAWSEARPRPVAAGAGVTDLARVYAACLSPVPDLKECCHES